LPATVAVCHDAVEVLALQEDHFAGETTVPADPAPNRSRIDAPQSLRAQWACHRSSIAVRHPGRVKAEARPLRRADALARNDAEHQRTSGQTISVDDDAFAR